MRTKAAKLNGRPTLAGAELRTFKAVLSDIRRRVEKIEHDCALLAMKSEMDGSLRQIFERLSALEEKN